LLMSNFSRCFRGVKEFREIPFRELEDILNILKFSNPWKHPESREDILLLLRMSTLRAFWEIKFPDSSEVKEFAERSRKRSFR
jgi:hypothetical protein